MDEKKQPTMPDLAWKKATCEVCGCSFDYVSGRKPRTCRDGECLHAWHFKINTKSWASYQPNLFDDQLSKG